MAHNKRIPVYPFYKSSIPSIGIAQPFGVVKSRLVLKLVYDPDGNGLGGLKQNGGMLAKF